MFNEAVWVCRHILLLYCQHLQAMRVRKREVFQRVTGGVDVTTFTGPPRLSVNVQIRFVLQGG